MERGNNALTKHGTRVPDGKSGGNAICWWYTNIFVVKMFRIDRSKLLPWGRSLLLTPTPCSIGCWNVAKPK